MEVNYIPSPLAGPLLGTFDDVATFNHSKHVSSTNIQRQFSVPVMFGHLYYIYM